MWSFLSFLDFFAASLFRTLFSSCLEIFPALFPFFLPFFSYRVELFQEQLDSESSLERASLSSRSSDVGKRSFFDGFLFIVSIKNPLEKLYQFSRAHTIISPRPSTVTRQSLQQMIKMLRLIRSIFILLTLAPCLLARSAIQYSDTTQLQTQRTLFLTKMFIHNQGFAQIFVELTDIKYLQQATTEKLNNSLWLYVLPRQQVSSLRGVPCLRAMTQIRNKMPVRYNTLLNFTLEQDNPEMFVAFLGFCPQEPEFKLNYHKFGVFVELRQDGSHLQRFEWWVALRSIIRFLVMWYIMLNVNIPYTKDSLAYGPIFMLGCSMIGSASQLLQIFYHKVMGHNYFFISDLPHLFSIITQQIIVFNFLSICCGWRSLGTRGDVGDLVAPFVICYGVTQLIMRLLYNYSPELYDLDTYQDSVYATIEVVCAFIIFWFGWINKMVLQRKHVVMGGEGVQKVMKLGMAIVLGVTLSRKVLEQGVMMMVVDLMEIALEVQFILVLLKEFVKVEEKPKEVQMQTVQMIGQEERPKAE